MSEEADKGPPLSREEVLARHKGGISLIGADLTKIDLRGASLSGANLSGARFSEADLSEADLSKANLSDANLSDANLSDANLSDANLSDAIAGGANLRGAILQGADLSNTNLVRADLSKAILSAANLKGACLIEAKLESAILTGADLQGATLRRSNFFRSSLIYTSFRDSDLRGAILFQANLFRANLSGADLRLSHGLRLDGQDIRGTRFTSFPTDPWSIVRSRYTGAKLLFHLLLLVVFICPYAYRALRWATVHSIQIKAGAPAEGQEWPFWQLLLGWDKGWSFACTGLIFLAYNVLRATLTWWLSQVRDAEERSGFAPDWASYGWCYNVHHYFMRYVVVLAFASLAWHAWPWLTATVVKPIP